MGNTLPAGDTGPPSQPCRTMPSHASQVYALSWTKFSCLLTSPAPVFTRKLIRNLLHQVGILSAAPRHWPLLPGMTASRVWLPSIRFTMKGALRGRENLSGILKRKVPASWCPPVSSARLPAAAIRTLIMGRYLIFLLHHTGQPTGLLAPAIVTFLIREIHIVRSSVEDQPALHEQK